LNFLGDFSLIETPRISICHITFVSVVPVDFRQVVKLPDSSLPTGTFGVNLNKA